MSSIPFIKPLKRLGQHFLHDPLIISRIVKVMQIQPTDLIVEIGPGLGALTKELLPLVPRVNTIEFDRRIIPVLLQVCQPLGCLIVHQADALQFNFSTLFTGNKELRLCGNLPYNIVTPLLFRLIQYRDFIQDFHFMVQKEVATRLTAHPGNKDYGRLSILIQYYYKIKPLFIVKPGAFKPRPKVDSTVIRLQPHSQPREQAYNIALFESILRRAFNQRRKTLSNNLKMFLTPEQMECLDINPRQRPEELTPTDYIKIANFLHFKQIAP